MWGKAQDRASCSAGLTRGRAGHAQAVPADLPDRGRRLTLSRPRGSALTTGRCRAPGDARDFARDCRKTEAHKVSRDKRKKVEMLFAQLKRILNLTRLRLRGPNGARDAFTLAAIAQNLRKLAKQRPAFSQTKAAT
jgi:hypothetical protein